MAFKNFMAKQGIRREISQLKRKMTYNQNQSYALGIGFYHQPAKNTEVNSEYNTILRARIEHLEDKLVSM